MKLCLPKNDISCYGYASDASVHSVGSVQPLPIATPLIFMLGVVFCGSLL